MGGTISRFIVRPPRADYDLANLPSSLKSKEGVTVTREPVEFRNSRDQRLIASFYRSPSPAPGNPCVIYLHGNASSQLEGIYVPFLVRTLGIHTLLIDLSGSGHSGGDFISLGYYERDDVSAACTFVRETYGVTQVLLWGRSMGATLGLWCAGDRLPGVVGCIADSPYASVRHIMEDMGDRSLILKIVAKLIGRSIDSNMRRSARVGVADISLWDSIPHAAVPCLIVHGVDDDFIAVRQSREIIARYGCAEKFLWTVPGDHGSEREPAAYLLMVEFALAVLGLEAGGADAQTGAAAEMRPDRMHYRNAAEMARDV